MSTLLLRLAAPLQSWGIASKFENRDSAREPTKSGVIGLLAAALGRRREEGLEDLAGLRFGVRIDQPGKFLQDYHVARSAKTSFVTTRHYLADAVFLAGLEGEENFLYRLEDALQNPFFPLYLGRRSCPPVGRLVLGVRQLGLQQALVEEPWQARAWFKRNRRSEPVRLAIVCDAHSGDAGVFLRRDLPLSFNQRHRQYGFRMVRDTFEVISNDPPTEQVHEAPTEHDAMIGWEG